MYRLHRYGFALLRGYNTQQFMELKCLDDYRRQLASDDPEMMAAVHDFHLEVDGALAELDRELAELKALVRDAYLEGGGREWDTSEAKARLAQLME